MDIEKMKKMLDETFEREEKEYDIANLNPRKNPYIGKLKKG